MTAGPPGTVSTPPAGPSRGGTWDDGREMPTRWFYDLSYFLGAPWEIGPRRELVELVESGRLSTARLCPGRAIDLGCGSGANSIYLAQHRFTLTGVDFAASGLAKARRQAERLGVADRVRFVNGELTEQSIPGVAGPFDLLVDVCTIDDVRREKRPAMAATVKRLSRPGSAFFLWCFYGEKTGLPLVSRRGPSRLNPEGLAPGEEEELFGDAFAIERLRRPVEGSGAAAFLMWRKRESD